MAEQKQKECREAFEKIWYAFRLATPCPQRYDLPIAEWLDGKPLNDELALMWVEFQRQWNTRTPTAQPDKSEVEETDCDHCANPSPTEAMLITEAGSFCPVCIERWDPYRKEDKAEVVERVTAEITAEVQKLPNGAYGAGAAFGFGVALGILSKHVSVLHPHRDDSGLVEELEKLAMSPLTFRRRQWVPLADVLALAKAALAKPEA